ncbi:Dolichyl-phosphate-mannose-protein mannosyltransferase-domain-containing protein [Phlyctochytrium arcticum]|nr:Dolichyl-phosphate-mannose-protein mannosyltransferase-domain-containing protein [Phlyctochytrium arcticum]
MEEKSKLRKRGKAENAAVPGTSKDDTVLVEKTVKNASPSKKHLKNVPPPTPPATLAAVSSDTLYNIALVIVTILSFASRCWRIGDPAEVVFDEVHFGKFASYYLRGEYYFDVHPPLGKLMLAGVGWLAGYDGHFLFDNIGDDYVSNNVPFVALRLLPATCGALIAPVVFLTMREMKFTVTGATFAAMLLVLDNSLITQSRLILLDSMLTLFCVCSIYSWVRFYKLRHRAFSAAWYFWLSATGFFLACTTGVKMVGLFTVAAIGVAVLIDLWNLLDIRRGLSLRQFTRHFAARALCLIFLPLMIYLSFFYIHFALLTKSGPGDAFMSPAFQDGLKGSEMNVNSSAIPYFANITLKHRETSAYLHSHPDKYPLRYEDGRVSTQGQQVTGYPHRDINNHWTLEPVDPALYEQAPQHTPSEVEKERDVRYLRHHDIVRLRHARTTGYLITHDVASPLTATHMEMTLHPANETKRYNETLWKVELVDGKSKGKVRSKRGHLRLVNVVHGVAVHCHKGQLPDWGFGQQEINGNKATKEPGNTWWVDEVLHPRIVAGVEIGETVTPETSDLKKVELGFLEKFLELQTLMFAHNAGLTKPHPYSSTPISWPFVLRGISFWERKDGLRQIYLLGNPIIWWAAITGTVMFAAMWLMDRVLLRRGIDDFGPIRKWWDETAGFVWICWLSHWLPFFLMGRMLFLHHYLPSLIYSVVLLVSVGEFCFVRAWGDIQSQQRFGGQIYIGLFVLGLALASWAFYFFAPLTYGLGFSDIEDLRSRKWMQSWDLQHA